MKYLIRFPGVRQAPRRHPLQPQLPHPRRQRQPRQRPQFQQHPCPHLPLLHHQLLPLRPPFARDPFDDGSTVNINTRAMVTGQTWAAATSWSGTILTTGSGNAYSTASNKMDVISADAPSADYTVSANVTYVTFNDWDIGVVGRSDAAGSNCFASHRHQRRRQPDVRLLTRK